MTPELILWGIPGYLTLVVIQASRPAKNRSGWDFVALTALYSLIDFAAASVVLAAVTRWFPEASGRLGALWHSVFPFRSFRLFLGLLIALGMGAALSRGYPLAMRALTRLSGTDRNLLFPDLFYAALNDLLGEPVLVGLTTGKVYVGLLLEASDDPNESERSIQIQPILSGYRRPETQKVTFNTDYRITDELEVSPAKLLLPMRAVASISTFDEDIHRVFVERGVTTVEAIRFLVGERGAERVLVEAPTYEAAARRYAAEHAGVGDVFVTRDLASVPADAGAVDQKVFTRKLLGSRAL